MGTELPPPWDSPGMVPVVTQHLPLAPGPQGFHLCLAALVVLAGLYCSFQTFLAPLASQAHLGGLGDQVALVGPAKEEGDNGQVHPSLFAEKGSCTHPQGLQVTTEPRALHVNECLGKKHKGNIRAEVSDGMRMLSTVSPCHALQPPRCQGYLPARPAWRSVLEVRGDLVVLGGPLAPHRGHPMGWRGDHGSQAQAGCLLHCSHSHWYGHQHSHQHAYSPSPPSAQTLLVSPGTLGAPSHPVKGSRGIGISGWWGTEQLSCAVYPATLPTYRFAVLTRITLGMAKERDEWSTGEKGSRRGGLDSQARHPCQGPHPSLGGPWGQGGQ